MTTGPKPVGRPPIGDVVKVRLDAETLAQVDDYARSESSSRAAVLRFLIRRGLDS